MQCTQLVLRTGSYHKSHLT